LKKLRNEKAFERRLAWYEDTVSAVAALRDACVLYARATRYDTSQLPVLVPTVNNALMVFADKASKAILYAPPETFKRFESLVKELVAAAKDFIEILQRHQLYEPFAKKIDALAISLNQLVFDLAQEVRGELGIGKIEVSDLFKNIPDKPFGAPEFGRHVD